MSPPLIAACLWVLAASVTALLPMRVQYVAGTLLLATAIPLLVWIGATHGAVPVLLGCLAIVSLFRRPLGVLIWRLKS